MSNTSNNRIATIIALIGILVPILVAFIQKDWILERLFGIKKNQPRASVEFILHEKDNRGMVVKSGKLSVAVGSAIFTRTLNGQGSARFDLLPDSAYQQPVSLSVENIQGYELVTQEISLNRQDSVYFVPLRKTQISIPPIGRGDRPGRVQENATTMALKPFIGTWKSPRVNKQMESLKIEFTDDTKQKIKMTLRMFPTPHELGTRPATFRNDTLFATFQVANVSQIFYPKIWLQDDATIVIQMQQTDLQDNPTWNYRQLFQKE